MQRFVWSLVALFGMGIATTAHAQLKAGDAAPDFSLAASDGKTYKLSDFQGKQAVVVAWYPRAFTPGCTKECTSFREQGAELRKYNVAYFTASCDPVDKNTKFAKELNVDYPILCDVDGAVAKKYGIYNPERNAAQRHTFIISPEGKVLEVITQVNTMDHGKQVAERLAKLGVAAKK